jgi:ATP-binding cassette subfamily B protein
MASERRRPRLRLLGALLRPHAAGEGRGLALGALLGLAVVAAHVLRPWPLKWILDYVTGAPAPGPVLRWVAAGPAAGVFALAALFVALAVAGAMAEYAQVMLLNGLGNRVLFRFRAALFAHVLRQPLAFHESHEIGELLTRVVYDTSRLRRGINGLLIRIVQTLALFLATSAVLLWVAPGLGILLTTGVVLALVAMQRSGRRIARAARKQRIREGSLAALVATELAGVRELQASGVEASAVQRRFAGRNDRSLRQEQKVRRLAAGLSLRVEVMLAVGVALALWLGARQVMAGALTAGSLALFFSYALALRGPLADFAYQTARLGRTWACADRLARIAGRTSAIADRPGAVPAPPLEGALRLEAVALKAGRRRRSGRKWTLDGVSWDLPAGRRVAIVGPNGAGKSTLLSLVLRLADPVRGRVLLDGRDLREFTLDSVRSQVSVVFQDTVLTGLSVAENIALGVPGADRDAVEVAATAARADALIRRLPQGYDTVVRRGGRLFSGGELQRLALARALLRRGRVWLLDEPTTGLDHATAEELVTLLLEVTRGRTTLWVTHEPELVRRLDHVLALEHGKVAFSGRPADYFSWLAGRAETAPPPGSEG